MAGMQQDWNGCDGPAVPADVHPPCMRCICLLEMKSFEKTEVQTDIAIVCSPFTHTILCCYMYFYERLIRKGRGMANVQLKKTALPNNFMCLKI